MAGETMTGALRMAGGTTLNLKQMKQAWPEMSQSLYSHVALSLLEKSVGTRPGDHHGWRDHDWGSADGWWHNSEADEPGPARNVTVALLTCCFEICLC